MNDFAEGSSSDQSLAATTFKGDWMDKYNTFIPFIKTEGEFFMFRVRLALE